MKRNSSNCLRVSIGFSRSAAALNGPPAETKHERTLSVRYVFCNLLIWSEKVEMPLQAELKDDAGCTGVGRRGKRLANQQAICRGQWSHKRAVLVWKRCGDRGLRASIEGSSQIVLALVIGRQIAA